MPEAWNLRLLGQTDLDGHGDAMHVQLHGDLAYVGHMGEHGTSIVDVSDPAAMRVVGHVPAAPNTHAHKVQIVGDVMLTNRELIPRHQPPHEAGLAVYSLADPRRPERIAWWPCGGLGVHRMTWWEGTTAYVTAGDDAIDEQFLVVLDLADPSRPTELGRWWLPGQKPDEARPWTDDMRVKMHHAIVRDGLAYAGWWDEGVAILDVRDPGAISLVGRLDLGEDVARATHTFCPLPGRDVAVTTEERIPFGCVGVAPNTRLIDITDPTAPAVISTFPVPEGDFCDRGGRFGPHNVHEPKPGYRIDGDTIYLTYFNGGLRVYDVRDATQPTEIGWYVPDAPDGQPAIQLNDVTVAEDGRIFVTDRLGGGLFVLEATAGLDAARPA